MRTKLQSRAIIMRITVLMNEDESKVFEAYCLHHGFKKSTLINRLIREHIENTGFTLQRELFEDQGDKGESR